MLVQLKTIVATIKELQESKLDTYATLPLDARTTLLHHMATSAFNSKQWFTAQLNELMNPSAETIKMYLDENRPMREPSKAQIDGLQLGIDTNTTVHDSLCGELLRLSHLRESANVLLDMDEANLGTIDKTADDAILENDEIVNKLTAVKVAPHAWAMQSLMAKDRWSEHPSSEPVLIDMDLFRNAVQNTTNQLLGRWLLLALEDRNPAGRNDGRDLIIAGADERLHKLDLTLPMTDILREFRSILPSNGIIFDAHKGKKTTRGFQYAFSGLINDLRNAKFELEEEMQINHIAQTTHEFKMRIREKNFNLTTFNMLKNQLASILNVSPEDKEDLLAEFEEQLTVKQYKELMAA